MISIRTMCVIASALLTGCSTLGGAPEPSFDIQTDLKELSESFGNATSIKTYYAAQEPQRKDARNKFIAGRLALIDLRYLDYVRTLTSSKQQFDSTTQIAAMTLGIAGTLTGGVRAKSNLAAGVTALTGTNTIIDKNYFFDKSMDALVATMSAKRKEVLAGMLPQLLLPVDRYPLENAMADLVAYYEAGTLPGAIKAITTQATASEAKSQEKIRNYELAPFTKTQAEEISNVTTSISKVSLSNARAVLNALGVVNSDLPSTLDDVGTTPGAKTMLKAKLREAMAQDDLEKREAALSLIKASFKSASSWVES